MKITLISTFDSYGGAGMAASRLKDALLKQNEKVCFLVRDKQSKALTTVSVKSNFIKKMESKFYFFKERLVIFISNKCSKKYLFQMSIGNTGEDIENLSIIKESDIIHLHWINQGFLSIRGIEKLMKLNRPIIWTMHDLWPGTAICHYPGSCEKYQTGCFHCPYQINQPIKDLAKKVFKEKLLMNLSQITFVGCSEWITKKAKKSLLLQGSTFYTIPNPIDTHLFCTKEKINARKELGLPSNKTLLLFIAAKLSDSRKGMNLLVEACHILEHRLKKDIEFVLIGGDCFNLGNHFCFPIHNLGYISEAEKLATAYNCCDMFIIPSLEDNLPNTIMESMACGTPCVGFSTGGIPEMIDHKQNGYLAEYKNAADLANGIQWVLENNDDGSLSKACIQKVEQNYSESVVAEKYIALYKKLLDQKN